MLLGGASAPKQIRRPVRPPDGSRVNSRSEAELWTEADAQVVMSAVVEEDAIGAVITVFTGRSVLSTGLRQIVFGLAAATVTFAIGHLFSVLFGI